ncbi:hypothetical protein ACFWZ2_42990 [Streptomyces sp. NPDC059002]|uniref:hypothetical protein n=1 Tax=Streptomyces sp. NPDC059002 TaxID=3346690 RepID=UPI003699A209
MTDTQQGQPEEQSPEPLGKARLITVVAILLPVLFGTATATFLLVGYLMKILDPEPKFADTLLSAGWLFGALTAGGILLAVIGLPGTALRADTTADDEDGEPEAVVSERRPRKAAASSALNLAAVIAGSSRAHLREEWASLLAGDPENGVTLSPERQRRYAAGFVFAAIRMRIGDMAVPLWVPVDWLLASDSRVNAALTCGVGSLAIYIQWQDGLHMLLTEGWAWCAGCGVALRMLFAWLRRVHTGEE